MFYELYVYVEALKSSFQSTDLEYNKWSDENILDIRMENIERIGS